MKIKSVWLQNFRNHREILIRFDQQATVIIGPNGSGKSNLLESLYLLALGKSFRAEKTSEIINWRSEIARIKGLVTNQIPAQTWGENTQKEVYDTIELEATLTRGEVQNTKAPLKTLSVNGVSRSLAKFVGNLRVVLFSPSDMRLIEGSPARRRGYLDEVLSQVHHEYRRAWLSYDKGLRRRNRVLMAIRDGVADRRQLFFWDRLLIKEGNIVTQFRMQLIQFLNQNFRDHQPGELAKISIRYDDSIISEQRLGQYAHEEVAAKATLVGPHRDDIQLLTDTGTPNQNFFELSKYGSRGQQRLAVLWLKIGAVNYINEHTHEKPVLLLDDIFSELDHPHRELVTQVISQTQSIVTAADEHLATHLSNYVVKL